MNGEKHDAERPGKAFPRGSVGTRDKMENAELRRRLEVLEGTME